MIDELIASINLIIAQTQNNLPVLELIVIIPWSVFFVTCCITDKLLWLGIIPRHLLGLPGILCAPLLHAHFNHIFFNSIPLLVLSNFILIDGVPYYLNVTLLITLLSGSSIWCFAKPGLYIGASALITGYWGLLISNLYQSGTMTAIILCLISLYYFAGILAGIIPGDKGVSWQGHLFGLLAGISTSFLLQSYPHFSLIS